MSGFLFNKMYVVESLDQEDRKTGTELFNDLLRWKELEYKGELSVELKSVKDKKQLLTFFKEVENETLNNNIHPIIHFEIHGSSNFDGLILASDELVSWSEIYTYLININSNIGNNLFITLAVCHGAYLMQLIKLDKPAPFWGFIGSFDTITQSDLMLRYYEFYKEFLDSLNLNTAFEKLQKANPAIPSTYRFISSEITFKNVYDNHLREHTSEKGIADRKKRVQKEENLVFTNRKDRRKFEKDFATKIKKSKNKYYQRHAGIFFMLDRFPENKSRFNIKDSLN